MKRIDSTSTSSARPTHPGNCMDPVRPPARRGRPPRPQPAPGQSGAPSPANQPPSQPPPAQPPHGQPGMSFSNDILAHLPPARAAELTRLVAQHRSGALTKSAFLAAARPVCGERLFARLAAGMGAGASSLPAPANQNAPDDEGRADAGALQDVMQYAGVDLRQEADLGVGAPGADAPAARDARLDADAGALCVPRLKHLVGGAVVPRGVREMGEDALALVAVAALRRVADLVGRASALSRHRAAAHRARLKIKVDGDGRRLHWLLAQYWGSETARTSAPKAASGPIGGIGAAGAAGQSGPASQPPAKRSDDAAVKTRMANVTAAAAAGVQTRAWMTAASAEDGASAIDAAAAGETPRPHFAHAPSMTPVTDRELHGQLAQRRITLADVVAAAETDAHLGRHSALLFTLHAQLAAEHRRDQ